MSQGVIKNVNSILENGVAFKMEELTITNDGIYLFQEILHRIFRLFHLRVVIKRDHLHIRMG